VSNTAPRPGEFELGTDGPSAIIVGIDDSTTSLRAAAYTIGLARRQRSQVVAVYVAPTPFLSAASPAGAQVIMAESQAYDEIAKSLQAHIEDAARDRGVDVMFIATHGDAFNEIKRIAEDMRADAIVVGASMSAGHKLIGSLAVRLVRAGRWPVTVVP